MVFTSHIFVYYFLPLLLLVYFNLPYRGRNLFLTVISYAFYGWWNPKFMLLMMIATVVNYVAGLQIAVPGASRCRRRTALIIAITADLGLLGFFKYWMFFTGSVNQLLLSAGWTPIPVLQVTLPIGISFYTFQALSYTVDVYRGAARPARSLVDFACFVALFPQLIAGPIIRYHTVAQQLVQRTHTASRIASGGALFMIGFSKKILLANVMGEVADAAFGAAQLAALDAWFGVVAYAFQIYFDFSAYSNMAIGLGRIIGFEFPRNFNAPYLADSITDFWRRWHISLSTFLRDYLYIPLGGNRRGPTRTYVNLATVMVFGGLWHGANWTFVAWGMAHGSLLIWERWMGKDSIYRRLPRALRVGATFVIILLTWVLFRAESLPAAFDYYAALLGLTRVGGASLLLAGEIYTLQYLVVIGACAALTVVPMQAFDWVQQPHRAWHGLVPILLFVVALLVMSTQAFNPFLYFQF